MLKLLRATKTHRRMCGQRSLEVNLDVAYCEHHERSYLKMTSKIDERILYLGRLSF